MVPCWNRQQDLERLERSFQRLHALPTIVVVDDCSQPPLRSKLGRVIRLEENAHRSVAKNVGLAACSTEFVWFLDSDTEILHPGMLDLAASLFDEHPSLAAVGCELQGRPPYRIILHHVLPDYSSFVLTREVTPGFCRTVPCIPTNNMIARTDVLREVGGFCPEIVHHEDKLACLLMRRAGYQLQYHEGLGVLHHVSTSGRVTRREELHRYARDAAFVYGYLSGPAKRRLYLGCMAVSRGLELLGHLVNLRHLLAMKRL